MSELQDRPATHGTEADGILANVRAYLLSSARVKERAIASCAEAIARAVEALVSCFNTGGKVLLCGNGGSAADCQHLAAEFVSLLTKDFRRPGLPAIALTTDSSILTAYSNDVGFEGVFARQVQALGREGDVLIAISTSGRSRNVLEAIREARQKGMKTIALTGEKGTVGLDPDVAISVPSDHTGHIQEAHVAIEHILCWLVERRLHKS